MENLSMKNTNNLKRKKPARQSLKKNTLAENVSIVTEVKDRSMSSAIYTAPKKEELSKFHFSSSGLFKIQIYKNDVLLATLFNSTNNKQAEYIYSIEVDSEDVIKFDISNKDYQTCDSYIHFER